MTLDELTHMQEDFDSRHEGYFKWNDKVTEDNLELLEFLIVSLTGELGETANIVKKVVRGDFSLDGVKDQLQEEIADMFIYLLKLAYQMDINLEEVYLLKLNKNRERFKCYEKSE